LQTIVAVTINLLQEKKKLPSIWPRYGKPIATPAIVAC
jgi:hypothetical protein